MLDAPVVAAFLEFIGIALADGVTIRVRVLLPKRDEFGAEAEADDSDVEFACGQLEWAVGYELKG
jgi:hypothetical protein